MTDLPRRRWGKAGERLGDDTRAREVRSVANRARSSRQADDERAYAAWRAGDVVPHLITLALDAQGLEGPEVDTACLAREPEVDEWEAGERYPSWWQLVALAELTGCTPRFFTMGDVTPLTTSQTSMCFHLSAAERRALAKNPPRAPLMRYPAHVLAARPPSPAAMPDRALMPTEPEPLALPPVLPDEGDQMSLFVDHDG